jgi:ribosomal protein L24
LDVAANPGRRDPVRGGDVVVVVSGRVEGENGKLRRVVVTPSTTASVTMDVTVISDALRHPPEGPLT